jgi:hypothetical protein
MQSGDASEEQNKSNWVHLESMMFLKDIIASRKMDGNMPPPDDVIEDSGSSTKHSEEDIVTDPFILTDESQARKKKRDIINSKIHHRPTKGDSF